MFMLELVKKKEESENLDIVSEFLLSTVLHRLRILKRLGTAYYAVNKWRESIADQQKIAIRIVKKQRNEELLDIISEQMLDASMMLFGPIYGSVTHVACGHSGPGCFARDLAEAVAKKANVEFIEAFSCLPVTGSSHPIKNKDRPPMQIERVPKTPTLLVDDVATSGSHICEATEILRARNCAVFPLSWIASS